VLSLSPGPAPLAKHEELAENAQLWRISGDFWDNWTKLRKQFDLTRDWAQYSGPGHWPDADMLPLGMIGLRAEVGEPRHTHFTPEEQKTMMTLWSICRSPLMFGGDLPSNDAATLALITNAEVLAVNQHSVGGHEVYRNADTIAWVADPPASSGHSSSAAKYVAVFNTGDADRTVELSFADAGMQAAHASFRDLWAGKDIGTADHISASIPAHGSALYRVTPK